MSFAKQSSKNSPSISIKERAVLGLSGENVCTRNGYTPLEDYWEELRERSPAYMIADDTLTEEDIRSFILEEL